MVHDEQVIYGFFDGTDESFEALIRHFESRVYNFSLVLTCDERAAESVLQNVFLAVAMRRDDFVDASDPRFFLRWLMEKIVDFSLEESREGEQAAFIVQNLERASSSAGEPLSSRDKNIAGILLHVLRGMPREYREVYWLKEVSRLSDNSVEEVLGLTARQVSQRFNRARFMIRRHLADYLETLRQYTPAFSNMEMQPASPA